MKKILIVGSGFNGFCNAYQLIKKNKYEVTIIEILLSVICILENI